MTHHENQDDHHGDAGQPEFPLPQGVVASPVKESSFEWRDRIEDSAAHFTSEQQQDNLPACCILPCSDKTEESREERRQRQDDPTERKPRVDYCPRVDKKYRLR